MIKRTVKNPTASAHDDRFSTAENWVDGIAVLSVRDAVDMLSAPQLSEAIGAALTKAPVALIVDLTDVDFLASVGMSVLVEAQDQASTISVHSVVGRAILLFWPLGRMSEFSVPASDARIPTPAGN